MSAGGVMSLTEIAIAVDGSMHGRDVVVNGVSTDTRTLVEGNLFVALSGPNFDGHEFVGQAQDKAAAALLLSRAVTTALPRIQVADTMRALGQLGAHWRRSFPVPLIGVTGSNGKTTVKDMIARILGQARDVLVTAGNLNNEIGVPITLCRLRPDHQVAVIEMGMNHAGEIDYLSRMARPNVAVITNAAPAHLEGLGDVGAVARAKAEIFHGLEPDGVAIINGDDAYAELWRAAAGDRQIMEFSLTHPASVSGRWQFSGGESRLQLTVGDESLTVALPLPGRHNAANALAAGAAAIAAGATLAMVKSGLESMSSGAGRLAEHRGLSGARILDDSYNANPHSVRAGIDVLAACAGTRVLVLGDMAELGEDASRLHAEVGEYARAAGIDRILAVGPLSVAATKAFGENGEHYSAKRVLIEALKGRLGADVAVLVKGSRSMRMEEVVTALAPPAPAGGD